MNAPVDNEQFGRPEEGKPATFAWPYLNGGTAVIDTGLVVKNVDKVLSVNTGIDTHITAKFYSSEICRRMRRDFHLLSKKMFMRARNAQARAQIQELLMELRIQGEYLKAEAANYERPQFAYPQEVPFRIVSREGGMLYRIMAEADLPFGIITEASKADVIKQTYKEQLLEPFSDAYRDLQRFLTGSVQKSEKTAAELGSEGGIS